MNQLDSTLQQLRGFIRQIDALRQSDFPYTHSEEALEVIGKAFLKSDSLLRQFDPTTDPKVVETACSTAIAWTENTGQTCLLSGIPVDLAEGDEWRGSIFRGDNFTYTDSNNTPRTVRAYIATIEQTHADNSLMPGEVLYNLNQTK